MSRRRLFQVLLGAIVSACLLVLPGISSAQGNSDNALERVKEVQERHTANLMAQEGVVGTAVGLNEKGEHAVLVLLERPGVPAIPTDLEGVPVRPVVTGRIYALARPQAKPTKPSRDTTPPGVPTNLGATAVSSTQIKLVWAAPPDSDLSHYHVDRSITSGGPYTRLADAPASTVPDYDDSMLAPLICYYYVLTAVDTSGNESPQSSECSATTLAPSRAPSAIGVSTGHPSITAGTIGCRVIKNGVVYALSNNHVYANENRASVGDNVLQPGPVDGGRNPRDAIGVLAEFEPIVFSRRARNTIDAAIALCTTATLGNSTPSYGTPGSVPAAATPDLAVKKCGRTTGLTHGRVFAVNATVDVGYSSGTARFVNQIMITPGSFSAGGDSGSLIVTEDGSNNPVGLLFAGSASFTIANPVDLVLDRFGVTVDDRQ